MVTRCVEALDRLEEVSQIYKKSSTQEKIKSVESILNKHTKKEHSPLNGNSKFCTTRTLKVKSRNSHNQISRNTASVEGTVKNTNTKTNRKHAPGQGRTSFNAKNRTHCVHQTRHSSTCKPANNPPESPLHRSSLKSSWFSSCTEDRTFEPLCWEEQMNSTKVKILHRKQRPLVRNNGDQIDSHPVVFHDKKWVEEMLLRRPAQFRITPCFFPEFQEKEDKKYQMRSGKRTATKIKCNEDAELELQGKGVPPARSILRRFTFHDIVGKNVNRTSDTDSGKANTMLTVFNHSEDNKQSNDSSNHDKISQNFVNVQEPRLTRSSSPVNSNNEGTADSTERHIDMPVCVPNACYTEPLVDDCRSVISCATNNSNNSDDAEIPYHGEVVPDHALHGYPKYSSINNVDSETIVKNHGVSWDDIKPESTKRTLSSSTSSSELLKCKIQQNTSHHQKPRVVYTPSSPSLFLSDEVSKLPRSVSPVKALMELRQNFCENIRKETKQLEFDLQELYLKKQLHDR